MQDKIEWYQEVVDLEPSSKLFFPLAKMVAGSDIARAVETLQRGLERHPEFIEARLFFVELLHKNKDQADYAARLETQLTVLSPLMMRYAGFWQAWGSILTEHDKKNDTGLAVSFMGALFENGSLSLSEVFAAGLQAITANPQGAAAAPMPVTPVAPSAGVASSPKAAPAAVAAPEAAPAAVAAPEVVQASAPVATVAAPEVVAPAPATVVAPEVAAPVPAAVAAPEVAPVSAPAQAVPARQPSIAVKQAVEKNPNESISASAAQAVKSVTKKPKISLKVTHLSVPSVSTTKKTAANTVDTEHEESEEAFSLRTRSMADVLAEQGDYAAALEIYQELMPMAASDAEKNELQAKIEQVQNLAAPSGDAKENSASSGTSEANKGEKPSSPGKERVISVLESLADRLETRVHS